MLAFIILTAIFLAIVIPLIIVTLKREKEIYENGLEADGVVSRVESRMARIRNGLEYFPYIRYVGDDGQEHEGLLNVSVQFKIGRKMRIKYLPGRYDEVRFISQEFDP